MPRLPYPLFCGTKSNRHNLSSVSWVCLWATFYPEHVTLQTFRWRFSLCPNQLNSYIQSPERYSEHWGDRGEEVEWLTSDQKVVGLVPASAL